MFVCLRCSLSGSCCGVFGCRVDYSPSLCRYSTGGLEKDLGQDTGSGFPLPEGICNRAGRNAINLSELNLELTSFGHQMCQNLLTLAAENMNLLCVGMAITYPRPPISCAMILPPSKGYLRDSGTSMALSLTPSAVGFTTSCTSEMSPLAMTAAS